MGRLRLYWDPEIDSVFRRRLERALGELHIDYADAGLVDAHPDERKLTKMALVSARAGFAPPQDSDLIVLAGPGEFSDTRDALRLKARSRQMLTARRARCAGLSGTRRPPSG